jgi:hypothetical protein
LGFPTGWSFTTHKDCCWGTKKNNLLHQLAINAGTCAGRDAGTRNDINAGAEAQALAADRRDDTRASALALMAKPLGAARAVAAQHFTSGRALAPLPYTPPEQPTPTTEQACAGADEDAFLAEEDEERP